jgi:alkanesulfonate monooxygenase SsuD/methylene tetrahydromethanopterin reductase-like flavin-dependent oxidoreductase (luciferase family)
MELGSFLPQVGPAASPDAMQRVATMADGWMPAGIPLEPMGQMMEGIRGMA